MLRTVMLLISLLLPTQLGLHFWPSWSFLHGLSVDYLSPTIYLTDLLLIILLFTHPPRLVFRKQVNLVFFIIISLSLITSLQPLNSFIYLTRLLLLLNFSHLVSLQTKPTLSLLLTLLCLSTVFISLLALLQFSVQSSLNGPFYWLGERSFTITTPGIAKTNLPFSNQLTLRSYSSFSHPNSLAGFLVVVILLVFQLKNKLKLKSHLTYLLFFLSFLALLSTFSKSAMIALFTALVSLHFPVSLTFFLIVSVPLLITILISLPLQFSSNPSFILRQQLNWLSFKAILTYPLTGVGLNNFTIYLSQVKPALDHYILQPVHNLFLLILSETGALFFFILPKIKPYLKPNHLFAPIILAIFITGSLDHYWLTLPQNRLLASFVLGFMLNPRLSPVSS